MGRTLKRVALDFNWPLDKIWQGYLNPHSDAMKDCAACDHSGYAPEAKRFSDQWYGCAPFSPAVYGATPLTVENPAIQAFARRQLEKAPEFYLTHGETEEDLSSRWSERTRLSRTARLDVDVQPDCGASDPSVCNNHPGLCAACKARASKRAEMVAESVARRKEAAVQREARRLHSLWVNMWMHNLIQADVDALIAAGRLMDFTHVARTEEQRQVVRAKVAAGENSWLPEPNGYAPTFEEVNAWSIVSSMAHDAINQGVCIRARCEREGVPLLCATCDGKGYTWTSPEAKKAYEEWKDSEPPVGPGYQMWETTTEGSPQSPVFATLKELSAWCAANAHTFASFKATAEEWETMLDKDSVCHKEQLANGNTMVYL